MGDMSFPGMSLPEKDMMYVVSNKEKVDGAVNVLNAYDKVSELLGTDDLVVLPSSVHEVIVVPASTGDYNQLRSMVGEVNGTEVAREEQLENALLPILSIPEGRMREDSLVFALKAPFAISITE